MSVSDGEKVNAAVTNAAYLSRKSDSDTIAEIDLKSPSYTDIISIQRVLNELLASLGVANQAATDAAADDYTSNNVVTNGDDRKAAIGKFDATYDGTTGHAHDGTSGQGAKVDAANLTSFNNLFAEFGEYTFDAASGTSIDVSSLYSGQSSGGDANTEGVITSAPNNYIPVVEKTNGGEIEDAEGDRVFARITEAAGVWTLSFYTNEAGTETAHSLASQDIRFLYREVFTAANRPTIGANVGVYDTQSAIGDIPDASGTQRGAVSTGAQTLAGAKDFTSRPTINSNDVADINQAQVFTSKDYDGGTASNTSRLTLPKNTTAGLDALTDKEATVAYDTDKDTVVFNDGVDWQELSGGAGGGGLDVYHTETFEATVAGNFSSGNNATFDNGGALAGTLADETTSPISGTSSLKYTQAAGSLNDWFKSPTFTIDDKQSGNTTGATLYFTYDGAADDIQFIIYDETNSAILTAGQDLFTDPINPTRYATSVSIPSTTTSLSYGCHVKTLSSGAVLILDDIEFSTDPFVIQNLVEVNSLKLEGNDGRTITAFTEDVHYSGSGVGWTSTGDTHYYTVQNSNSVIQLTTNIYETTATAGFIILAKGGSTYKVIGSNQVGTGGRISAEYTSSEGEFSAGDQLSIRISTGRTLSNFASEHYLNIVESYDSPALITPAKLPRTYSEANSDFTVTGTGWTTTAAEAVPYVTSDGTWRMKFNIRGTVTSSARTSFTASFGGVTFKNITNFEQPLAAQSQSTATYVQAYAQPNTGNMVMVHSSATTSQYGWSGDVVLDSKPTWADDVSSNFLAALPFDEFQTKTLSANFSTDGAEITDLTFNNLIVGNTYEVKSNFQWGTASTDAISIINVKNGSTFIYNIVNSNRDAGAVLDPTKGNSVTFIATDTTVKYTTSSFGAGTLVEGNGTNSQSWAQITEKPLTKETTRFT